MFNRNKPTNHIDPWFQERLSDYLDGSLSTADRARMEQILGSSAEARQSLEAMRWTVAMLHELPAPRVPRQFTLPVTQQVPARSYASWMVWGLRGVAAAAAIAFVLLLAGTLLRQPPSATTAMQAPASAPVAPTAMVAFQPSPIATVGAAQSEAANGAVAPTRVMITVEPPPTQVPQPTVQPAAALQSAPAPTQEPPQPDESQATELPAQDNQAPASAAAPAVETPTLEIASASAADLQTPPSKKAGAAANSLPTETAAAFSSRRALGPGIDGTVTASQLKVRAGPGTEYRSIGGLRRGDKVLAVGRSENNGWLKIDYIKDGETLEGWIGAAFVKLEAPIEELPIQLADLPPPTPEPTSAPPTVENSPTPLPTTNAPGKPTATPIVNVTAQPTASVATPTTEPTEQPTPADVVVLVTPTPAATPIAEPTIEVIRPPELTPAP